jgi:hypothetical protein
MIRSENILKITRKMRSVYYYTAELKRVTLQTPPLWQTGGAAQFHVADAPAK